MGNFWDDMRDAPRIIIQNGSKFFFSHNTPHEPPASAIVASPPVNSDETKEGKMIRGTRADYSPSTGCSLNILSNDELDEIHRATLDILNDAGIMMLNEEAQEIFYSHGCNVDKKSKIVRIPPHLVEEAIVSAPSNLLLGARNPKNDIIIEGTRVGFMPFGVAIQMMDLDTGKIRESTAKDVAEAVLLSDYANGVDVLFQPMTPRDVPSQVEDVHATEICFTNSSKHFIHVEALSTKSVRRLFEMGAVVAGGEEERKR
jgi:trimethylamine--corrinoid protein Co-methyltransferase